MNVGVKRFSEVAGEHVNVETIPFSQLVGSEIIIHEVDDYAGQYGPAYLVTISYPESIDKHTRTIVGGRVAMKQLAAIRQHLPVLAKVVRLKSAKGRAFYALE